MLANGRTTIERRGGPLLARLDGAERGRQDFRASIERIDPHRSHDVLEVLVSEIDEVRVDLAAHVVVGCARDQHAARLAKALHPGRDVDAIAQNVVASISTSPRLTPMR